MSIVRTSAVALRLYDVLKRATPPARRVNPARKCVCVCACMGGEVLFIAASAAADCQCINIKHQTKNKLRLAPGSNKISEYHLVLLHVLLGVRYFL